EKFHLFQTYHRTVFLFRDLVCLFDGFPFEAKLVCHKVPELAGRATPSGASRGIGFGFLSRGRSLASGPNSSSLFTSRTWSSPVKSIGGLPVSLVFYVGNRFVVVCVSLTIGIVVLVEGGVAELADLDGIINKGDGSDADVHRRREVVRLNQEVEKVDALKVARKTKIKWSIEGDENSKYYHDVLNKKSGRLTIREVLVDGIWMESLHLVKHEFFEHFKSRFEKPNKSRILLERDFVKRISLEQNDDLEREVSNEEIKMAVWDCDIDKAPGPDGFTFWFLSTVPNANMVKDFRPISFIGSLYKVIAKVLANCPVTVLDDIVDEIQSDFVTDRQILDGPFILNEIVIGEFGFEEKWCKWIQSCLYSSRGSVLVNGSHTKEFQFHKVVKALHGEDVKIGKKIQHRYPSTWINIINEIESLKLHGIDLVSFITLKLGNGANTSFWDVAW
nr:RNA-directed DNA polymerase, eukaryota [Tanacetum cinerariifolium]